MIAIHQTETIIPFLFQGDFGYWFPLVDWLSTLGVWIRIWYFNMPLQVQEAELTRTLQLQKDDELKSQAAKMVGVDYERNTHIPQ